MTQQFKRIMLMVLKLTAVIISFLFALLGGSSFL